MSNQIQYDYKERKIVAIVNEDLPFGLAMNAVGHLAYSAGCYANSGMMGENPLVDGLGIEHRGISKYAFMVLKGDVRTINEIIEKARDMSVQMFDYPQEMFETGHDSELVEKIRSKKEFNYQAVLLVGEKKPINKLTGSLKLYR